MATTKSKKALCHLVCEASGQVSGEVLKQELERNINDLRDGILCFPKPTSESLAAFTSKKNVASKLTNFILDLSKFIHVEETMSKTILQTYLSGIIFTTIIYFIYIHISFKKILRKFDILYKITGDLNPSYY